MRDKLRPEIERGRVRSGPLGSAPSFGMQGQFIVAYGPVELLVISSDGTDWGHCGLPGEPWEHVSVSHPDRCPTWDEMDFIKRRFWLDDEAVIQFHVPRSDHINRAEFCLHLWRPTGGVQLPPAECV